MENENALSMAGMGLLTKLALLIRRIKFLHRNSLRPIARGLIRKVELCKFILIASDHVAASRTSV
jgi:hypothetical protein